VNGTIVPEDAELFVPMEIHELSQKLNGIVAIEVSCFKSILQFIGLGRDYTHASLHLVKFVWSLRHFVVSVL
jgi:hypothetical protein